MKYDKDNKIIYDYGDWVTITSDYDGSVTRGKSYKIGGEYYRGATENILHIEKDDMGIDNGICGLTYRPATQEEINKSTKEQPIMVGDYKVDFGNGARGEQLDFIKVGCVTVGRLAFLEIKEKAGW